MYAVVLAGGSGTRLWPWARAARPKQFLPLLGGQSPFARTLHRIRPLVGERRTLVVAGAGHARWIRQQAPEVPRENVILEDAGRNTAASIAFAAAWIRRQTPEGIMIVLPSDHEIRPAAMLRADLRKAVRAVAATDGLVTIGVPPRSADTGFGYILPSSVVERPFRRVGRFIEKPSPGRAARMVRSRRYLWNSGIFIWRARSILAELARHQPAIASAVGGIRRSSAGGPWRIPREVMRRLPAVSIDRAVLERSGRVLVARASFSWSDLGTWAAVASLLPRDRDGNRRRGLMVSSGASDCLAITDRGVIALLGTRGMAVIRAGDSVLVCPLAAAQDVRRIVESMRGALRAHL